MIRLAGSMMIAVGCLGLGLWYRQQFALRVWHLRRLDEILEMMMSEVRYSKATLPECCLKLSRRLPPPYGQTFEKIQEDLRRNKGESFGIIFGRNMRACLEETPLKKAEKEIFLHFSETLGFEDTQMQLLHMEQYKEQLKDLTDRLGAELTEKGRIALRLGGMGGLLLIILFC